MAPTRRRVHQGLGEDAIRAIAPFVEGKESKLVLWEDRQALRILWLNREKALHALNKEMCVEIQDKLQYAEVMNNIQGVMIKGMGDGRAFCAGGDVRAAALAVRNGDVAAALEFFREEFTMNLKISQMATPVIAIMDGITFGGGVGLSAYAPFRIATERCVAAMPECAIGFFPDVGTTRQLSLMPHNMGTMMALTGTRLKGRDVVEAGLATHFVPSFRLVHMERRVTEVLHFDHETQSSAALRFALKDFSDHEAWDSTAKHADDAYTAPADSIFVYREHIERAFAMGTVEGIVTQLTREITLAEEAGLPAEPLVDMLESMATACPLSLKVTLRRLQTAGEPLPAKLKKLLVKVKKVRDENKEAPEPELVKSLADTLRLDFQLVQHFVGNPNFLEGVRARLIDKDHAPRWEPPTLEGVTDAMVDAFFQPAAEKLTFSEEMEKRVRQQTEAYHAEAYGQLDGWIAQAAKAPQDHSSESDSSSSDEGFATSDEMESEVDHLRRAMQQVPPGAQHHSSSDSSSTSDDERVTNFPDSASDEEEDGELVSSSEDEDERKPAPRKSKLPSKL